MEDLFKSALLFPRGSMLFTFHSKVNDIVFRHATLSRTEARSWDWGVGDEEFLNRFGDLHTKARSTIANCGVATATHFCRGRLGYDLQFAVVRSCSIVSTKRNRPKTLKKVRVLNCNLFVSLPELSDAIRFSTSYMFTFPRNFKILASTSNFNIHVDTLPSHRVFLLIARSHFSWWQSLTTSLLRRTT